MGEADQRSEDPIRRALVGADQATWRDALERANAHDVGDDQRQSDLDPHNHPITDHNLWITERQPAATRDRLLEAGTRLFAERGFRETSVGDIESAVGLQPRRGALYRHFKSKEGLLQAAVAEHLARIEAGLGDIDATATSEPLDALMALGRWFLAELDAAEPLFRILEQDGHRLPHIRDVVRDRVIDAGHRRVSDLIRRRAADVAIDVDAAAALIIGPLANHRRTTWTFGRPPLGLDDERLLQAWHGAVSDLVELGRGRRDDARRH